MSERLGDKNSANVKPPTPLHLPLNRDPALAIEQAIKVLQTIVESHPEVRHGFDYESFIHHELAPALEAARFSSHKIAYLLRLRHFHPEAPVEACEHLFQCGITPPSSAPSPLGGFDAVLAEYDGIVNGRLDPRDAEADFVMRGSDWRAIRAELERLLSAPYSWARDNAVSAIGGWRSIDTAPHGVELLLWWRPLSPNKSAEAVVLGQISTHETGKWWNSQRGEYQELWHVTHWMPKPNGPTDDTGAKNG